MSALGDGRNERTASALSCGSCGAGLPSNSKFCNRCGAPVAQNSEPAEYKQVTVLFADVVRSMDIAASVDIERLREIMNELMERSAAVVRRYGGSVEYTGDGVMAIFGVPVALEDHAFRACLAALAIQDEATRLAADVRRSDKVALQLRVGLNSGQVIAGDIGAGPLGYRATGGHIGMAQRMESVAPPGGVTLSESTAGLVEQTVTLAEAEWVRIKGTDEPVRVRRLMAIKPRQVMLGRTEASLVGRRWELASLVAMAERAMGVRGGVVNVVGPPGIGKSRVAREAAALAADEGFAVFWTFCESHAGDIPFGVVAQLLRVCTGAADLSGEAARARVRHQFPDADPQDLLLLDDLLGIADPEVPAAQIDRDARRRRLTRLINDAWLARTQPALFVIEDVHWIDPVSESMLVDFLAVVPQTRSMVLITSRSEYQGGLVRVPGAEAIVLGPLGDSDVAELLAELLGSHPSVVELATKIADRAAGNPFFAEEMVRELAQRGTLAGEHGGYEFGADLAEVKVPATVQAAIEARIDRLSVPAKRTLNAASVLGARFGADLLLALGIYPLFDELLAAELIEQVRLTPTLEFAFRHPLIRAVAYESQLRSGRARWHRHVAAAIQQRAPESVEENAALIAEHLQAAGELHAAHGWHMRAAAWSSSRDIVAARTSWERALNLADQLPADTPNRIGLRIAPRTMLCATDWLAGGELNGSNLADLRTLCAATGDYLPLAMGMAGQIVALAGHDRYDEATRLATDLTALVETIGQPRLTVGLLPSMIYLKSQVGEMTEALRLSEWCIDLSEGDPTRGALLTGSPLVQATMMRGMSRLCLGIDGWRSDANEAVARGKEVDRNSYVSAVMYKYIVAVPVGALSADSAALAETAEALRIASEVGDDHTVALAHLVRGVVLVHHGGPLSRAGFALQARGRDIALKKGFTLNALSVVDPEIAREKARIGDLDGAIELSRSAIDDMFERGAMFLRGFATTVLVESLLARGADGDRLEAQAAIDRLADVPTDPGFVLHELPLRRLRALLSHARGDEIGYRAHRDRYGAMATQLGFEEHMKWAAAMP